jgi:hypothetical protein
MFQRLIIISQSSFDVEVISGLPFGQHDTHTSGWTEQAHAPSFDWQESFSAIGCHVQKAFGQHSCQTHLSSTAGSWAEFHGTPAPSRRYSLSPASVE